MTDASDVPQYRRAVERLREEMLERTHQSPPASSEPPVFLEIDEIKVPDNPEPAAELSGVNDDLLRQGRSLKLSLNAGSDAGTTQVIEALVYYIPAAAMIELYVPSIRWCTPIPLQTSHIPTHDELLANAEEMVERHFSRLGQPQPPVRLAFRVPNNDEMQEPDPPSISGRFGYGVPGFGHIDQGYVRSAHKRPPGSAPIACPSSWFSNPQ